MIPNTIYISTSCIKIYITIIVILTSIYAYVQISYHLFFISADEISSIQKDLSSNLGIYFIYSTLHRYFTILKLKIFRILVDKI